jgi:hypothetical protein
MAVPSVVALTRKSPAAVTAETALGDVSVVATGRLGTDYRFHAEVEVKGPSFAWCGSFGLVWSGQTPSWTINSRRGQFTPSPELSLLIRDTVEAAATAVLVNVEVVL